MQSLVCYCFRHFENGRSRMRSARQAEARFGKIHKSKSDIFRTLARPPGSRVGGGPEFSIGLDAHMNRLAGCKKLRPYPFGKGPRTREGGGSIRKILQVRKSGLCRFYTGVALEGAAV